MTSDPIAGAARRRTALEQAMQHVEHAAAAASGRSDWSDDLTSNVTELAEALNRHIVEVESPSGLLDQIVDKAPRLQRAAEETKQHHVVLTDMIDTLLEMITSARKSGDPPVGTIRSTIVELLNELTRHRQDGADLIYEAYDVDIGGY